MNRLLRKSSEQPRIEHPLHDVVRHDRVDQPNNQIDDVMFVQIHSREPRPDGIEKPQRTQPTEFLHPEEGDDTGVGPVERRDGRKEVGVERVPDRLEELRPDESVEVDQPTGTPLDKPDGLSQSVLVDVPRRCNRIEHERGQSHDVQNRQRVNKMVECPTVRGRVPENPP